MIAYMKCACRSRDKALVRKLKQENIEVRIVKGNQEWRRQAAGYKVKMPFLVDGDEVRSLE